MKREEFKQAINSQLSQKGYKKVSVSLKFFGLNAIVTCRDKANKKHTFEATMDKKHGELYIQYRDLSSPDWIDELEFLDAMLNGR